MFSYLIFYTSFGYNLVRNYLQPQIWKWYDRVDDNLIIGALPLKSMLKNLKNENVGGVVCCTEEFELKAIHNAVNLDEWKEYNIEIYHVPMRDFTGSTSRTNMKKAVDFIQKIDLNARTCYVHCKAGRTRSATVAACYLMQKYNYTPNVAFEIIKEKRKQVVLRDIHWRSLNEYRRSLDFKKN